ncbi:MAG: EscS/YscS/HrcS family type III secretion system export apparatus protein [Betaproteobacteria bacterium CG2_30_59_46]|nr:MAG: EscS/YscS/HrcS family type III secretion system export apparatus protein [Betaproteobacteria bacterium CG2_30_59_46]PIQ11208.1 MAG: flagellar biosynthetic protein FliQ [Hydrogenophilales bacterium CG18_big_fil_WC_8_21_14_2_50_58_12]PIX99360.1 MAG: flagellar biosynthetic protein FliQ [Hydrogenophilales bacterium CG_4_10_14_3_um_filter_58_23]PJB08679.1 MAG: flagellar biosynthetic protein FliQ [Hydrogenophilales bacterium CG_4_9_14_3_um_filter_59_35]
MTPESVITIGQQAVEITLLVSAPLLLSALAVGLLVSIFQAATQINEMTLSFIPKLLVMFFVLVVAGPWMLNLMMDYTSRLFSSIPGLVG